MFCEQEAKLCVVVSVKCFVLLTLPYINTNVRCFYRSGSELWMQTFVCITGAVRELPENFIPLNMHCIDINFISSQQVILFKAVLLLRI